MILQALKNMYPKASENVLLGYIARHHKDLEKGVTNEQKEIFEKFHDCWSEYASLAEEAIFAYAFQLGGRLMLETRSEQRKK